MMDTPKLKSDQTGKRLSNPVEKTVLTFPSADDAPEPRPFIVLRRPGPVPVIPLTFGPTVPDTITVTVTPAEPVTDAVGWAVRLKALADAMDTYERSLGGHGLVLTEAREDAGRFVLVLASLPAKGWEERRVHIAELLRTTTANARTTASPVESLPRTVIDPLGTLRLTSAGLNLTVELAV